MGADRWSVCPGCLSRAKQEMDRLKEQIQKTYGISPMSEWLRLHAQVDALDRQLADPAGHFTNLRQVFSFTMTERGLFQVEYHGYCTGGNPCGFDFGFTHEKQVM